MESFAHLHVHSEFSMLDGAGRVDDLVAAAAADGQPAMAVTDHGVLYATIDFYKAAERAGIKPIIGMEAYLTPGSRFDRPPRREDLRYHMSLMAVSQVGYANLLKLASRAYLEGYYYKPRVDLELLAEHAEGLVATSGCLGGHVPQLLAPDASVEEGNRGQTRDYRGAVEAAGMYQDIFGPGNFFIEVQDHGIAGQQQIMGDLLSISEETGAPLLATNDTHYTYAAEAEAHDVLLCIQTGTNKSDVDRLRFGSEEFYIKSARQMRALFPDDEFPGACDNTLLIAERADVTLSFDKLLLPHFPVPAGQNEATYLRELVLDGVKRRYGDAPSDEVFDRVEYELEVIIQMGFASYFLIVWDLITYANERGIRTGPGRGERRRFDRGVLPRHHQARSDRIRPHLRALSQSGTPSDAGHRYGLRRAISLRRDPLLRGPLWVRSRCADRHVLDDQGPPGCARRGSRARTSVRPRRSRREVDAAGHPRKRGNVDPMPRATRRRGRPGRS